MCWWLLQALTIGRHYYRHKPPSGQGQVCSPLAGALVLVLGVGDGRGRGGALPTPMPSHYRTYPLWWIDDGWFDLDRLSSRLGRVDEGRLQPWAPQTIYDILPSLGFIDVY